MYRFRLAKKRTDRQTDDLTFHEGSIRYSGWTFRGKNKTLYVRVDGVVSIRFLSQVHLRFECTYVCYVG